MNFLKSLFYFLFFISIFSPWNPLFSKGSKKAPYSEFRTLKQGTRLTFVDEEEVRKQEGLDNKISFSSALEKAKHSFLSDFDEGNETPLDIIYERAYEQSDNTDIHFFGKTLLSSFFELESTSFTLVSMNKVENDLGFNPYKNWVFQLKVPELGDYTFWCVVPRNGEEPQYTFGEN